MTRFSVPMTRFWDPMTRFSVPLTRSWDPPAQTSGCVNLDNQESGADTCLPSEIQNLWSLYYFTCVGCGPVRGNVAITAQLGSAM